MRLSAYQIDTIVNACMTLLLIPMAAWVTSVVACMEQGNTSHLIADAIFPPIGIIHGFSLWFGGW